MPFGESYSRLMQWPSPMSSPQAVAQLGKRRQTFEEKTRRLYSRAKLLLSDSQRYCGGRP
jgi:hypothetical protein